ncbi:DUF5068 domain-containing protein [Sporosarcina sp. OR05]|uniref:DUF5068 domain-containing protein n=1 Tax=Sporosarcina sp. OR05 TaxID=2969819 RepID=UPI00352A03F6
MFKRLLGVISLLALLLLAACGSGDAKKSDNETSAPKIEDESSEKVDTESKGVEENDAEEAEEKEPVSATNDKMLNTYLEEETGGDIEIVFTNNESAMKHNYKEDVSIEINKYQIVHVTNMNESAKSSFEDADEGYVMTYQMTIHNNSDEDVYYTGGMTFLTDDGNDYIMKRTHFVDRDEWLKDYDAEGHSQFSKGKAVTGLVAFMITNEQFEKMHTPILKIDKFFLEDDTSKTFGEEAVFTIPMNEASMDKAASVANLYPDKMVTDTIADKEIFYAEENIDETKEIDGVKITLNGVQYANITPTDAHKERFKNFGDGPLVALTTKTTIQNGSEFPIPKFFMETRLHIDDNRGTMLSQGMLEPTPRGNIEPGDSAEIYHVYLFREDEFQIYKKLDFQVGPFKDEDVKPLFKEKTVTFTLPKQ